MSQQKRAAALRRLHQPGPLVLPNAWDATSARLIERAGAQAIATTSAGVSWALGHSDGEGLEREPMVAAIQAIAEAVEIPVTADIESGYGTGTPRDVYETVSAVLEAGAVGINLEDAPGAGDSPLLEPEAQAERLRAARSAAQERNVDLFINARTDVYLRAVGDPEGRADEVMQRAASYLQAGADSVFVPGVADAATIASLVAGIDAPLNVMAGPGSPTVQELAELSVARVSLGPGLTLGAFGWIERVAREVLANGTYDHLGQGLTYPEANEIFRSV
ncbi:MAG: isocitrate lyase/phosphoenolpyruvate mutase family protein [Acidobacteriota bacterium]